MKGTAADILDRKASPSMKHALAKTAYLSYYISMYCTVSENLGYENAPVTVDEVYDFLRDIRHETGDRIPNIDKDDISFCFHVLHMVGICKKN